MDENDVDNVMGDTFTSYATRLINQQTTIEFLGTDFIVEFLNLRYN